MKRIAPILAAFALLAVSAFADDEIKIKGKPVSKWIAQLTGSNRGLQVRASRALAEATPEQIPHVAAKLIPILESKRENDRFVAAQTLGKYGPPARAAVPKLVPLLKGTQFERNRAAAAKALGLILADAEPSEEVEKVTAALTAKFNEDYDQYEDVRREAAWALGKIGLAAKSCIPKLERALTDVGQHNAFQDVRRGAAWTCGRMGIEAKQHIDRLISMMHREGKDVPEIAEAIGKIGPVHENVIPNIMDVIEKSGRYLTSYAPAKVAGFEALARFGKKSASAVPLIRRFLKELKGGDDLGSLTIRTAALKTLAAVGPPAKAALPEVTKNLDPNIRVSRRIPKDQHAALRKNLLEAAAQAYKAITGKEPPKKKKD
jgi:HEAT repeat protein